MLRGEASRPLPSQAPADLQRQLKLLRELEDLIRRQCPCGQVADAENRRLRSVIEEAAIRLGTMLTGERASRARERRRSEPGERPRGVPPTRPPAGVLVPIQPNP